MLEIIYKNHVFFYKVFCHKRHEHKVIMYASLKEEVQKQSIKNSIFRYTSFKKSLI